MDRLPAAAPAAPPAKSSGGSDGNLDTALLETIFYNEMMLMDESSSLSSDFLAYLSSDQGSAALSSPAPVDASAIAERALLSDFGVSSAPTTGKTAAVPATATQPAAPGFAAPEKGFQTPVMPQSEMSHQQLAAPPVAAASAAPVAAAAVAPTTPPALVPAPAPLPPAAPPPITTTTQATAVSKERAQQLVSQFATLATRLGISLPPNVLSSLTDAAALNEEARRAAAGGLPTSPMLVPSKPASTSSTSAPLPAPAVSAPISLPDKIGTAAATSKATPEEPTPEVVRRLRNTAEEAISAVLENRKRTKEEVENNKSINAKPLYSKRRKKPRLSDCEAKLASLREENEMLKRHLDTVTNQSNKFEAERKQTEHQMRQMIKECVEPEKLNPVLHKYSEMYSDYGRHRNQELLFHLQQLEKLAAPTNFTKMGLWSLGQSEGFYTNPKQNPIAGILRKELGITPAQGRKILEQRQKIRDVCNNLKECFMLLGKLKSLCEHKQKVFHDRMSKCQEILTPPQVAKLLLWVDENSHLLESVCPGWGSERIHTTEKPNAKST